MTMTVRLRIYLDNGDPGPWEEEAAAWFSAHPDALPEFQFVEGSIFVTGDGQEAQFHDSLPALVSGLCFGGVEALIADGEAIVRFYSSDTAARLRADGGDVELASTVVDPVRFPRAAVLQGLVSCGERFVALAETLWGMDPDN